MAELSRFDKLRLRTEEQLIQLIDNELDRGIRDARHALRSAGTWAITEELYHRAQRSYAEVSRLIPLAAEISEDERSAMESRLEDLRRMLAPLEPQTESDAVCLAT
jgi:hypothetical protein